MNNNINNEETNATTNNDMSPPVDNHIIGGNIDSLTISEESKRLRSFSELTFDTQIGVITDGGSGTTTTIIITYKEYKKNRNILEKLKKEIIKSMLDLFLRECFYYKSYIKSRKISISAKLHKTALKETLESYYILNINAEKIQKAFRNSLTHKWFSLRGPALKNRNMCVNETDFCTLEPLVEIENKDFFSYKDSENGCIFGFDIRSLWMMFKKKGIVLMNPTSKGLVMDKPIKYNNSILANRTEKNRHNRNILNSNSIKNPYNRSSIRETSDIYKNAIDLFFIINLLNESETKSVEAITANTINNYAIINFPLANTNTFTNQQLIRLSMQTKMFEIRNKPVSIRITQSFIEIGYLDFYTDANWFFNLNHQQYFLFLRKLKNIWDYGFINRFNRYERILDETKNRICFLHDPFLNTNWSNPSEITLDAFQKMAIYVVENLINLGIDGDHKRLGAMYVLAALTTVSNEARSALNWLYENFNIG
jgi:hypothetical protein